MVFGYSVLESQVPSVIKLLKSKNITPILDYAREHCKQHSFTQSKILSMQHYNVPVAIKLSSYGRDYNAISSLYDLNKQVYVDAESLRTLRPDNKFIRQCWSKNIYIGKTYQMYRKNALLDLKHDIHYYGNEFPIKLVRGAYYWKDKGRHLFTNNEQTDDNYNNAIEWLQKNEIKNV